MRAQASWAFQSSALLSRPSCTCVPRVQSRREVEHVVRAYRGAVGIDEADILAPGAQEFSVPIIDDDGMGAAREDVDIILTIDADGSSIAVRVAGRKFAPVLDYPIPVLSFSENDGRRGSARGGRVSHRCDSAEAVATVAAKPASVCRRVIEPSPARWRNRAVRK
jgi:hypothetical protein